MPVIQILDYLFQLIVDEGGKAEPLDLPFGSWKNSILLIGFNSAMQSP